MDGHILIAEDSPTQAMQLRYLLEEHNYPIVVAANGQEALAAAREHRPDLIISDIIMPIMNGYEMCHAIKQDEALQDVPVILLTALSDPADIVRGLQAGTDYYVTKPYDEAYLLSTVELALAAPVEEEGERAEEGLEVVFAGEHHVITSGRQQILNLLLSTYGNAVQQNRELVKTQHELERLNKYLEERVRERTQQLQASEAQYRGLLETNADAMVVVDRKGIMRFVNPAAEALFGYKAEDLLGELFGFPVVTSETAELDIFRRGGQRAIAEMRMMETVWGGESAYLASLRDVTARKRAEEAVRVSHCFLEIANRHRQMEPLLEEFAAEVKNFTGCAAVGIRLLDEQGNIPYQTCVGFSQEFCESEGPLSIRLDQCMCINVIKGDTDPNLPFYTERGSFYTNGTTCFLATVSEEEKGQTCNVCNQVGYESVALIPVHLGERILGLIHVADPREDMVPLETVEALEGAAMQLGTAIQRVRAEEGLQTSEERYRNIFHTAAVSLWEENFSAVRAALDDLKAQGVEDICSYLDEHPEFVREAARRVEVLDVNQATLRMFRAKSKDELLGSLDRVLTPEGHDIFREELVAISEGKTYFEDETVNHTLQGEPLNILLAITFPSEAERFNSVLVSKVDITARKRREREREAVATVSAALRVAPTRGEMLPVILDQLLDLMNAEGAALAIRDQTTGETVIELARGQWLYWSGECLPPGAGVGGQVIATGEPYVDNDMQVDPLFGRSDVLYILNAVACVPLIVQEQTIGALWVGRNADITDEEVRLLTAIGDMAASAIHRATLHEQTERRLQQISALRTIDMAITSSLDLRVTLGVLLDQVTVQLGVDAADVLLLGSHTQTLEYAAGRGFRSHALQHPHLRLGEGHAGRAALERCIVSVPDLAEDVDARVRTSLLEDEGFVAYCGAPLVAKGHVKGVLEVFHRSRLDFDADWQGFLEAVAGQAAIAIDNAELFDGLQRSNMELTLAYDTTLEGWARALELRDMETEGHAQRVVELTLRLAQAMGMREAELVHVNRGALLHDIGKMGIPDSILLKPGRLTDEEWEIMRQHPVYAYQMLLPIAYLRPALDIPYCHHERWDGTGYPRGLKGAQIPLAARIFALVDVWDALLSDRPYRPAWPKEKVMEYIREQAGRHFDPQVVEVFLRVIDERRQGT
jgi:response regulator RpfG family c-di-GMP phosphodiesterase